jgi:hypothetical protein
MTTLPAARSTPTVARHLVLQTRGARLRSLVRVEAIHREMCEAVGFTLFSWHFWRPPHATRARRRALALLDQSGPRPFDPEVFLVFTKADSARPGRPEPDDVELLQQDFIQSAIGRVPRRDRFPYPIPVKPAMKGADTAAGALIFDTIGGGTTAPRLAPQLGCRCVGYEVDAAATELACANLAGLNATKLTSPDTAGLPHDNYD